MTTTTTPAAYLYALPEPIQSKLVDLARAAIGMSQAEKEHAHTMFSAYVFSVAALCSPEEVPAGRMVLELGSLLRVAYNEAGEGATA